MSELPLHYHSSASLPQRHIWNCWRYDPARGFRLAFSTYAVPAIRRRLWDAVAQAQRLRGYAVLAVAPDPAELAVLSGTATRCGTGYPLNNSG